MRLLLDTSVLIDLFARRRPFFADCERLLTMRAFGDAEPWVSAKSYTDVFHVLKKAFDAATVQKCSSKAAST